MERGPEAEDRGGTRDQEREFKKKRGSEANRKGRHSCRRQYPPGPVYTHL